MSNTSESSCNNPHSVTIPISNLNNYKKDTRSTVILSKEQCKYNKSVTIISQLKQSQTTVQEANEALEELHGLKKYQTKTAGIGIKASNSIMQGSYICIFDGEYRTINSMRNKEKEYAVKQLGSYALYLKSSITITAGISVPHQKVISAIDPTELPMKKNYSNSQIITNNNNNNHIDEVLIDSTNNLNCLYEDIWGKGRYFNDADSKLNECNMKTEICKQLDLQYFYVVLVAKRNIYAGEELRFDYGNNTNDKYQWRLADSRKR
jgi:hypothetical protein